MQHTFSLINCILQYFEQCQPSGGWGLCGGRSVAVACNVNLNCLMVFTFTLSIVVDFPLALHNPLSHHIAMLDSKRWLLICSCFFLSCLLRLLTYSCSFNIYIPMFVHRYTWMPVCLIPTYLYACRYVWIL